MDEYSRIILEEYCMTHKSEKSKKIGKLVKKSYDVNSYASDAEAIFLERAIEQEKDETRKEALIDLDNFLFGY